MPELGTGVTDSRLESLDSSLCFYRAMLCIRGTRHGPVSVSSVCLSVCPSVCHKSEFY